MYRWLTLLSMRLLWTFDKISLLTYRRLHWMHDSLDTFLCLRIILARLCLMLNPSHAASLIFQSVSLPVTHCTILSISHCCHNSVNALKLHLLSFILIYTQISFSARHTVHDWCDISWLSVIGCICIQFESQNSRLLWNLHTRLLSWTASFNLLLCFSSFQNDLTPRWDWFYRVPMYGGANVRW